MWPETVMSDEQIENIAHDAFKNDALLEHYVESRGHWEQLAPFLIKAQAEITWKARDKEVEEARQEGFVKGHKVGRKEGIDEGIQRAELFMQRNLPINVELNPKWLAFKKEVSKGE